MSKMAYKIVIAALVTYSVTMTYVVSQYEHYNDELNALVDVCLGIKGD